MSGPHAAVASALLFVGGLIANPWTRRRVLRLYRGKILLELWSVGSSTDNQDMERDHVLCIVFDWMPLHVKAL